MAMGHIYMQKITKTVRFAQSLKPQIQEHKLFFYLELTCRSMYSEERQGEAEIQLSTSGMKEGDCMYIWPCSL